MRFRIQAMANRGAKCWLLLYVGEAAAAKVDLLILFQPLRTCLAYLYERLTPLAMNLLLDSLPVVFDGIGIIFANVERNHHFAINTTVKRDFFLILLALNAS